MRDLKAKILHAILLIFVLGMFLLAYGSEGLNRASGEKIAMADGWTIKYNDEVFENVSLNEFRVPVTGKGDWFILTTTVPNKLPEHITLRVHSIFSVTTVYVDGEKVFEYGLEDFEKGRLLGYGTSFVSMPDDIEGKELMITMFVTEENAFSSISVPEIYNTATTFASFFGERIFPLSVAITLIVAGAAIAIVTTCMYFKSYSMERLFCIGVFAVCVGCWSICNYSLNYILTSSLRHKVFLEYYSLFLIPFPILLYFREDVEERHRRWESLVYYALLIIQIELYIVAVITQALNLIHLPSFLRIFQLYMAVAATFILYFVIRDLRENKDHKALSIGFAIIFVIAGRDLLAFNFNKYLATKGTESDYKSYFAAGVLMLVMTMLVDFIHEMRKQMYQTAETEFLEKIAYEDVLTNLYTRRKCEEIFTQLDKRTYEYALIQFDLNNLKNVNDEFGHEEGDELIKRFASDLRKTFTEGETIGRMGGDEFIVIVSDVYEYDIEAKLKALEDNISEDNKEYEKVPVSVSVGYCLSREFEKPVAADVYKEADKRMYKQKEAYYKKRGYKRRKYDME